MKTLKNSLVIFLSIFILCTNASLFARCSTHQMVAEEYSIVYVHIGESLPSYLEISMAQARLFNPTCPIILIANEKALKSFTSSLNIETIPCESLSPTREHNYFSQNTRHFIKPLNGFWRYTSERFLYLNDYMQAYAIENVFHLENDVMLYADLKALLPLFIQYYPGIATTFERPHKCIPGFVYISNKEAMKNMATYFAKYASRGLSDMKLIGIFKDEQPNQIIGALPMMMTSYAEEQTMESQGDRQRKRKQEYCQHIDAFNSIFDAVAIGTFLGGIDPSKVPGPPDYTRADLFFNPSLLTYEWQYDQEKRKIPYARYGNEKYKINNLHIASKKLHLFTSK